MQCLKPYNVSFKSDGKTLAFREKDCDPQFVPFQVPCGSCIECRLQYARELAVRCVHEAFMHEDNSFITLTYSDSHLVSPKLQYYDFQSFVKRLRDKIFRDFRSQFGPEAWFLLSKEEKKIYRDSISCPVVVTGEYGEKRKRPHWHTLIFNYRPPDLVFKFTSDSGEKVFSSEILDSLWQKGETLTGSVTYDSANYVARYSAKKLVHGFDDAHDFHPIHKRSQRYGIGRSYIERFWKDVFSHGYCVLPDGSQCSIPRYYERWFRDEYPDLYRAYVTGVKVPRMSKAQERADRQKVLDDSHNFERLNDGRGMQISRAKVREVIVLDRFRKLQENLKGDI